MPRRRMVGRRAGAYRVQSSSLRTSVNEFVTRFGTEGVLSIQLESEDRWYARPGGLLLIGLIITILGGVAVVAVEQVFFSR